MVLDPRVAVILRRLAALVDDQMVLSYDIAKDTLCLDEAPVWVGLIEFLDDREEHEKDPVSAAVVLAWDAILDLHPHLMTS